MALSGVFMWLAELRSPTKSWRFLLAFGLVIAIGCGIFLLIRVLCGVRSPKVSLSVLALAGFLFGLFEFWYANEYTPSTAPPALTVSATLTPPAKTEGRAVPVQVAL